MKINNKLKGNINNVFGSNQINSVEKKKKAFLEELKGANKNRIIGRLDDLLDQIDQQGERLSNNRTFKELIRYKKLIQSFMEEAIDKMYNLKEDYSPMQGKIHTVVKSVDSSLEELTEVVMDKEVDRLEILEELDEIRGLLVDLYR
ncbi:YaaR family protein [Halonatronum saccharophilum]|uniref:YaaR family protein n=1 Tax=Halonatronum saccharophilum TaxID=150060 RepID=UPI000480E23A|nr:YaaR family protein [Halonatronum saccharophilum]